MLDLYHLLAMVKFNSPYDWAYVAYFVVMFDIGISLGLVKRKPVKAQLADIGGEVVSHGQCLEYWCKRMWVSLKYIF